jgi:hypothetical protein
LRERVRVRGRLTSIMTIRKVIITRHPSSLKPSPALQERKVNFGDFYLDSE